MITWILVPKFLESHEYQVISKYGKFEIRKYQKVQIIEVAQNNYRKESLKLGFRKLIKYISSENELNEKISMTIPVLQRKNDDENWAIKFVLPKKYDQNNTPKPDDSEIKIKTFDINHAAIIKFSGVANNKLISKKENQLKNWIKEQDLIVLNNPIYAFYNDPLTPGIFRRNEIIYQIKYSNSN